MSSRGIDVDGPVLKSHRMNTGVYLTRSMGNLYLFQLLTLFSNIHIRKIAYKTISAKPQSDTRQLH
jgi:hypothetical protein